MQWRPAALAALRRQPVDRASPCAVAVELATGIPDQQRQSGPVAASPRDRLSRGPSGGGRRAADTRRAGGFVAIILQPCLQGVDRARTSPVARAGARRQGQRTATEG